MDEVVFILQVTFNGLGSDTNISFIISYHPQANGHLFGTRGTPDICPPPQAKLPPGLGRLGFLCRQRPHNPSQWFCLPSFVSAAGPKRPGSRRSPCNPATFRRVEQQAVGSLPSRRLVGSPAASPRFHARPRRHRCCQRRPLTLNTVGVLGVPGHSQASGSTRSVRPKPPASASGKPAAPAVPHLGERHPFRPGHVCRAGFRPLNLVWCRFTVGSALRPQGVGAGESPPQNPVCSRGAHLPFTLTTRPRPVTLTRAFAALAPVNILGPGGRSLTRHFHPGTS